MATHCIVGDAAQYTEPDLDLFKNPGVVLQAFPWNETTRMRSGSAQQPAASLDPLCPICTSPLTDAEVREACQHTVRQDCLTAFALHLISAGSMQSCMQWHHISPHASFRDALHLLPCDTNCWRQLGDVIVLWVKQTVRLHCARLEYLLVLVL